MNSPGKYTGLSVYLPGGFFYVKGIVFLTARMGENSIIGAMISLGSYVILQSFSAMLIYFEIVGETAVYFLVCISAATAAFLGCGYHLIKGTANMLNVSTVIAVFLTLTIIIGILSSPSNEIGFGLTGIGVSMVVGGLLAEIFGNFYRKKQKTRRDRMRMRRTR